MKYTTTLLPFLAIAFGQSSCTMERQAHVQGSTIEWTRKHPVHMASTEAPIPTVTAASFEMTLAERIVEPSPNVPDPILTADLNGSLASATPVKRLSRPVQQRLHSRNVVNMVPTTVNYDSSEARQHVPATPAAPSGGKSQLVALLLCFFLGLIGIHRFYLGYTWQGVVQILTLGGLGVWSLIDLIRIIIGDLGPKDGQYDKTL